jgi:hypothetical protein
VFGQSPSPCASASRLPRHVRDSPATPSRRSSSRLRQPWTLWLYVSQVICERGGEREVSRHVIGNRMGVCSLSESNNQSRLNPGHDSAIVHPSRLSYQSWLIRSEGGDVLWWAKVGSGGTTEYEWSGRSQSSPGSSVECKHVI